MVPARDFVDGQGKWIGGVKEQYGDWKGEQDDAVERAIRRLGMQGRIGQRDMFLYPDQGGKPSKYYIYETNLREEFEWSNQRLVLYSDKDKRAVQIPMQIWKVRIFGSPRVTFIREEYESYKLSLCFFIPEQGIPPDPYFDPKPGTMMASINIPL